MKRTRTKKQHGKRTLPALKKGVRVAVFQDPISGQKPEGMARLHKEVRGADRDGLSLWEVYFDEEPGQNYLRTINSANCFFNIS